jgi:glycosyltransferase involved in cell wall biosynthesis
MPRFLLSSAIDLEKLEIQNYDRISFGRAHYSWKIIARLYTAGLQHAGFQVKHVVRPEIYNTEIARKVAGVNADDIHICVKPVEHIRPFCNIKNVFISGWEFPELLDRSLEFNPLYNQKNILAKAESIWCWSSYTANNLIKNGLHQAVALPPPVLLQTTNSTIHSLDSVPACSLDTKIDPNKIPVKPLSDFLKNSTAPIVFLSILNPFDKRKQIVRLIECFISAWEKNKEIVLVIKLVIDNVHTTLGNIQEILQKHYSYEGVCKNVVFISQNLSEPEMVSLYKSARFYLTAASTEGLNLPLIEAMSFGIVPVSPRHSAMIDYIEPCNALIIEHEVEYTGPGFHGYGDQLKTTHFPPVNASLITSILQAAKITETDYKKLSKNASQSVFKKYSLDAFSASLKRFMLKWLI